MTEPLLSVRDLRTSFFQDEGTTKAVDGASFDVKAGKTLGIVGEIRRPSSASGQCQRGNEKCRKRLCRVHGLRLPFSVSIE